MLVFLSESKVPSTKLVLFSHLPLVGQTGLELFAGVLRVLDVDKLLVDRCGVIEHGLPASVHACHRRPHAHRAPEVIGHIQGHHVLDAQAEGHRAFDLTRSEETGQCQEPLFKFKKRLSKC